MGIHTAGYTYSVEGYQLPSGAEEQLFAGSFGVIASESYDWWTSAFTVPHSAEATRRLQPFDKVVGPDDRGFGIARVKGDDKIKIPFSGRLEGNGDWIDPEGDVFESFAQRLLELRDEVVRGACSGLELIAARFDPANWQQPEQASDVARFFARNVEGG